MINEAFANAYDEIDNSWILINAGKYKASIVHSYYSMFSAASALLIAKNIQTKTHEGLISEFGRLFVKNNLFNREIFKSFTRSRTSRKDANYDFSEVVTEEKALNLINDAENFYTESPRVFSILLE